jgi:hypothetical protein
MGVRLEPLQQLNLTGMVDVVRSHTGDQRLRGDSRPDRPLEIDRPQGGHRRSEPPVSIVEQLDVGAPGASRRLLRTRRQFDPLSAKEPRADPVNRRHATYFQYAA